MKQLSWILLAALVGCSKAKAPAAPPETTPTMAPSEPAVPAPAPTPAAAAAPESLIPGDYACSFSGYPEFLCRITAEDNFVTLAKLGGSDRFSGSLARAEDDLRWINAAANAEPAELLFQRQADGTWFARTEGEDKTGYRLRYLGEPGSQFGGQDYGGAIAAAPTAP